MACTSDQPTTISEEPAKETGEKGEGAIDIAAEPVVDIAKEPVDVAAEPVDATAERKRVRKYQWTCIFVAVMAGVIVNLAYQVRFIHEILPGMIYRLLNAPSTSFAWMWVWFAAYPPNDAVEAKQSRMLILAQMIVWTCENVVAGFVEFFSGPGTDGWVLWMLFESTFLFGGLWGFGLVWRYRSRYGGFKMLCNNGFGIFTCIFYAMCWLTLAMNNDMDLFMLGMMIFFLVLTPYIMVCHPKLACARRRFRQPIREKVEHDGGYVTLLMISLTMIPISAGLFLQAIMAASLASSGAVDLGFTVVVLGWTILMAFFAKLFKKLAAGAILEKDIEVFLVSPVFVADSFLNLVFMNVQLNDPSFWAFLVIDWLMLVIRDADLWSDLGSGISRCVRSVLPARFAKAAKVQDGKALTSAMQFPVKQASLCMVTELTATLFILVAVLFDIVLSAAGSPTVGVTCGMTTDARAGSLAVFTIVLLMQVSALAVAEVINKRRCANADEPTLPLVVKMWEEHFYFVLMTLVMGVTFVVRSCMNQKLLLGQCEGLRYVM